MKKKPDHSLPAIRDRLARDIMAVLYKMDVLLDSNYEYLHGYIVKLEAQCGGSEQDNRSGNGGREGS